MNIIQYGHNTKLLVIDDLHPEDLAMLQAIYSRSAESAETHIEKVKKSGSGKFMSTFYVGYGHKSIADCGTTTMFIEGVSLLAAKAIQDWPLYNGQETSTRYIDMSKQHIIDPVGTPESKTILDDWMMFYTLNQDRVAATIRKRHPPKEGEKAEVYEKAVKARVFDSLRGFLPAGITTQLSWHSNLRQAGDHLNTLRHHPAEEIRTIAIQLRKLLGDKYPSSGMGLSLPSISGVELGQQQEQDIRRIWETIVAAKHTYPPHLGFISPTRPDEIVFWNSQGMPSLLQDYEDVLNTRPRGCVLPHFMSDLGQCHATFLLDFGSFRDIQRHRNGVCRMPLLSTRYGFESWYLNQLDPELKVEAEALIEKQTIRIRGLTDDPVVQQYYTALGFQVATSVTYSLPAMIYVMELRSGKMIHPTLRKKIHGIITEFRQRFPKVVIHVDNDADDWDVRRGTQTITEKV